MTAMRTGSRWPNIGCAELFLLLAISSCAVDAATPKPEVTKVLMSRALAGIYVVRVDRGSLVRIPEWLPGGDVDCFVVYEATVLEHLGGERIPVRMRFSSFRNLSVGGQYVITLRGGTDLRGIPPAGDQILGSPREAQPYCVRQIKGVYLGGADISEVVDSINAYGYVVLPGTIAWPTTEVVEIDRREVGVTLEDLRASVAQQGVERWVPLEAKSRAALR